MILGLGITIREDGRVLAHLRRSCSGVFWEGNEKNAGDKSETIKVNLEVY